jgi:hypothetical protein
MRMRDGEKENTEGDDQKGAHDRTGDQSQPAQGQVGQPVGDWDGGRAESTSQAGAQPVTPAYGLEDNRVRAATYLHVVDGDTFYADILLAKLGTIEVRTSMKIRVHNYNADELSEPEGIHMRDQFAGMLMAAKGIRLYIGSMSHDRIVCDVYLDGQLFGLKLQQALAHFRNGHG